MNKQKCPQCGEKLKEVGKIKNSYIDEDEDGFSCDTVIDLKTLYQCKKCKTIILNQDE